MIVLIHWLIHKVTKENNWVDNLAVNIYSDEFLKWLNNEAFD